MNDSGNPVEIDWGNPDYAGVLRKRQEWLGRIRRDKGLLVAVKEFYREDHYFEFIRDWGMTRDPRKAAEGKPTVFPFIPFQRQRELLDWIHARVLRKERGVVDKTRDCGASWIAIAYSIWFWLFHEETDIGFGSRKEELVDSKSDPKSLFQKARDFIGLLPKEFRPEGWDEKRFSPFLKIINPENGSTIIGEAGDNIGRGGRTIFYFLDEAAFIERAYLVEAALSETTLTQIDISTHNGPDTLFYKKTRSFPQERVFEFDWRDVPWKTEEWYWAKKNDPGTDPVIFAQEVDRDPSASVNDAFIPAKLVDEAMGRKEEEVIGSGPWIISVDVAAMGADKSIVNIRRGDLNREQVRFKGLEGDELAAEVERICDGILRERIAPIGAIIYELEGPGYGFHVAMKAGRYKEILRPIHPGRKLQSREFYNERARFWGLAKEWLEEGFKKLPKDRNLRMQLISIRFDYKVSAGGMRKLVIEGKEEYRKRLAVDKRGGGPSPDEADAFAMSFAPVRMGRIEEVPRFEDELFGERVSGFVPLDPMMGY